VVGGRPKEERQSYNFWGTRHLASMEYLQTHISIKYHISIKIFHNQSSLEFQCHFATLGIIHPVHISAPITLVLRYIYVIIQHLLRLTIARRILRNMTAHGVVDTASTYLLAGPIHHTTRHHISYKCHLYIHYRENLRPHMNDDASSGNVCSACVCAVALCGDS
jgi:hypothetical protein